MIKKTQIASKATTAKLLPFFLAIFLIPNINLFIFIFLSSLPNFNNNKSAKIIPHINSNAPAAKKEITARVLVWGFINIKISKIIIPEIIKIHLLILFRILWDLETVSKDFDCCNS